MLVGLGFSDSINVSAHQIKINVFINNILTNIIICLQGEARTLIEILIDALASLYEGKKVLIQTLWFHFNSCKLYVVRVFRQI